MSDNGHKMVVEECRMTGNGEKNDKERKKEKREGGGQDGETRNRS